MRPEILEKTIEARDQLGTEVKRAVKQGRRARCGR
jgi:hypothetical protein